MSASLNNFHSDVTTLLSSLASASFEVSTSPKVFGLNSHFADHDMINQSLTMFEGLIIGLYRDHVKTVIGARIQDAVLTDDRVMGISDLDVKILSKEALELYVIVHTIYGRIEYRKELMLS